MCFSRQWEGRLARIKGSAIAAWTPMSKDHSGISSTVNRSAPAGYSTRSPEQEMIMEATLRASGTAPLSKYPFRVISGR